MLIPNTCETGDTAPNEIVKSGGAGALPVPSEPGATPIGTRPRIEACRSEGSLIVDQMIEPCRALAPRWTRHDFSYRTKSCDVTTLRPPTIPAFTDSCLLESQLSLKIGRAICSFAVPDLTAKIRSMACFMARSFSISSFVG